MADKQKATIKKLREENNKLNKENRQLIKERDHFKKRYDELYGTLERVMPDLKKLDNCIESAQVGIECLEIVSGLVLSPDPSIE